MFGEYPDDLPYTEEQLGGLIERFENETRKIGLYLKHAGLHVDPSSPDEPSERQDPKLVMIFGIGSVAFSSRVQDPEQDEINDEFRRIASSSIDDDIESIRQRYKKENDGD